MFDSFYISIIIFGFGGGAVRGLVGFVKQFSFKNPKFDTKYFLVMMFISGVIGLLTAVVVKELNITFLGLSDFTPALAFLVGYAGGDLLENLYKIIIKKPVVV
jgi:hypothetical protein